MVAFQMSLEVRWIRVGLVACFLGTFVGSLKTLAMQWEYVDEREREGEKGTTSFVCTLMWRWRREGLGKAAWHSGKVHLYFLSECFGKRSCSSESEWKSASMATRVEEERKSSSSATRLARVTTCSDWQHTYSTTTDYYCSRDWARLGR